MPVNKRRGPMPGTALSTRQVKQVQKIVEKNKLIKRDNEDLGGTFDTTGDLYELTNIAKGDESFQRDTDRIAVKRVKLSFSVQNVTANYNSYRVMVVRSKIGPLVAANFPTSIGNADYDKMQVYYDKFHGIGPGITLIDQGIRTHQILVRFSNKKVPHLNVGYDETASATLARDNPLYMWIVGHTADDLQSQGFSEITWFDKD